MPAPAVFETPAVETACEAASGNSEPADKVLAELVARIARQDESALAELYDATVSRLFSVARAILRNTADAEEIIVDTFTQVWQTAPKYDPSRGTVMGWVATICRSRALDLLRRQRTRDRNTVAGVETNGPDGLMDIGPQDPGPQDLLELIEENTAVHRALTTLSPLRRRLISLAFFRGLSHAEICKATGLPLGTVKSHIRRSLVALQTELDKEGSRHATQSR